MYPLLFSALFPNPIRPLIRSQESSYASLKSIVAKLQEGIHCQKRVVIVRNRRFHHSAGIHEAREPP